MSISTITPPSVSLQVKTGTVARTDTTQKALFGIPKGSIIRYFTVNSSTASDAGTTAVIDVGTSVNDDRYVAAEDVTADTSGYNPLGLNVSGGETGADLLIYGLYAETGTASTTGGPWNIACFYTFDGN